MHDKVDCTFQSPYNEKIAPFNSNPPIRHATDITNTITIVQKASFV